MKVLILNGPNINLLERRSAKHYGSISMQQIEKVISKEFKNHKFEFFQSNHEGEIIGKIHSSEKIFDGIIINPGGYSHTSIAIKDALEICSIPKIEVHLSNIAAREDFRHTLLTASSCDGYISGFRENSYTAAVYLLEKIKSKYETMVRKVRK